MLLIEQQSWIKKSRCESDKLYNVFALPLCSFKNFSDSFVVQQFPLFPIWFILFVEHNQILNLYSFQLLPQRKTNYFIFHSENCFKNWKNNMYIGSLCQAYHGLKIEWAEWRMFLFGGIKESHDIWSLWYSQAVWRSRAFFGRFESRGLSKNVFLCRKLKRWLIIRKLKFEEKNVALHIRKTQNQSRFILSFFKSLLLPKPSNARAGATQI